ncbi:MAG: 50S ribosome-binding GTPase [Planctomycetaceae bacterium]|jgi:septin family protein|nr:50S ribosome-binding GTPase [Planctomycetaceae bacterium]
MEPQEYPQNHWIQSVLVGDRLEHWGIFAPEWGVAQRCRQRTDDFARRTSDKRRRLGTPIIAAMLGGTGTGKSSLVNALLGQKVVQAGNVRPTTNQPTLICRPNLQPEEWGINTSAIRIVYCDSPALDRLVLLDCPDPDTTENADDETSNLAKLRNAAPFCDVLLVTGTQQKYRDHDVLDELAKSASGARLVFVQTHAEYDDDIRADWSKVLQKHYETGKIYFVDSLAALEQQNRGESPTGDFAELYSLLTKELSEETAIRIREANYVDRAEMTVEQCREDLRQNWTGIEKLQAEVQSERQKLGEKLSEKMQSELRQDRRLWESQLISEVSSRWWFSPFSMVLRLYLLLCDAAGFLASFRNRSIMGLAMGKASEIVTSAGFGNRRASSAKEDKAPSETVSPQASSVYYDGTPHAGPLDHINGLVCWDMIELQKSALSLPGYLSQAGLPEELCVKEKIVRDANDAGRYFIAGLSGKVHDVCGKLARRYVTFWLRLIFEAVLSVFIIAVFYGPAKAFFYETWFKPSPNYQGMEYYLTALFLGAIISIVLLTIFLHLLRRGLEGHIRETVDGLIREFVLDSLFIDVRREIRAFEKFRAELDEISTQIRLLRETADQLDQRLGKRKILSDR